MLDACCVPCCAPKPMSCPPPNCCPTVPNCPPTFCPTKAHCCDTRELHASVLYIDCHCIKRNGLQDECPRRDCQGRPCCLTKPEPLCRPSCCAKKLANMTMGKPSHKRRNRDCEMSCPTPIRGKICGQVTELHPIPLEPICYPCGPAGVSGPVTSMPCNPGDHFVSCPPCGPPCIPYESCPPGIISAPILPCGPCSPCITTSPCSPSACGEPVFSCGPCTPCITSTMCLQ